MMRFTSLHMKDFRATRDLEIGFEPDVTVIVGRNGAGKTSILDALCIMMHNIRGYCDAPRISHAIPGRSKSVLRIGADEYSLHLKFTIKDHSSGLVHHDIAELIATNWKATEDFYCPSVLKGWWTSTQSRPRFIYFRQERGFELEDEFWSSDSISESLDPDTIESQSLTKSLHAIGGLEAWWDRRDAQEARRVRDGDQDYRDPQLDAIRSLIAKIDSFSGIIFDSTVSPPGLHFVKKDNTPVHVRFLSSGERSFIILLADLARRLQIFQPDKPVREIAAIVLIDEIELNLHPAWQSRIVPMLSEVFATCQFIVTTHSPQVLSGVESRQVRIVEVDATDGSSKVTVPLSTRGRTSNYLLEGVLGSSERFPPVDALIDEFNEAIDGGDSDTAAARLAALEEQIEDDAATLLVLRKRLKKLRGAA